MGQKVYVEKTWVTGENLSLSNNKPNRILTSKKIYY